MRNSKEMSFQIILGSALAARRRILVEMGYHFTVVTADIDEKKSIRMDKPKELVMVLAEAKADTNISRLQSEITIEWGCSCYIVDYCRHGGGA
ncbi:hypothetical protein EV1_008769 [Malus domestica]